jgi:hypothetical protein
MAGLLDDLGQSIIPSIFSSLNSAGLVDTMTVKGETVSAGTGGGQVKSAAPDIYTNVPVTYRPLSPNRYTVGDKLISVGEYELEFPTHQNGTRINIDPKAHRLVVNARGNEPAKTFRIVGSPDDSGVVYICRGEREN